MNSLTPMLNTANFEVTLPWYKRLGFRVLQTNRQWAPGQPLNWNFEVRDPEGNALLLGRPL